MTTQDVIDLLVRGGMAEQRARETAEEIGRLGNEPSRPDPANDPFLQDIRRRGLAGKHTIELTADEMKALTNPDAAKGRG